MTAQRTIGIIGCGNISLSYLKLAPLFPSIRIKAVADVQAAAAAARAKEFGANAVSVDALLADPEIEAIINLTIPAAHYEISDRALSNGKHVYTEKPFTLTLDEARKLIAKADASGLKIASAPDTFLGGAGQTARRLLDEGAIGRVVGGTAQIYSHGMEAWHPNPVFFFQPGGGPVLDLGPYYLTLLVNLLGPIKSVAAFSGKGTEERLVTAPGPNNNTKIPVGTPTSFSAILQFASGAQLTFGASWDVWAHGHANPLELYGTEGTMLLPDPNFFGGTVQVSARDGGFKAHEAAAAPFGAPNWEHGHANYRMLGVADMLDAATRKAEPRCSGRMALHVLEAMDAILRAGEQRRVIDLETTCERPAALTPDDAVRLQAA